jgi:tungstate transport system ATP-binding protein
MPLRQLQGGSASFMPDEIMRAPRSELPITIEDVSLRSGGVTILESVSLVLAPGAPTVLIGPNGSGKSSLLRLAMGLLSPTIGRVMRGGRAGTGGDRRAIVFQRPVMLRRSVAANIAFALRGGPARRRERSDRVAALLHLVGLAALAARPARRLSGGEQQRLALARALARDPEVLFLDEPTANLDPAATKAVEDIIVQVASAGVKIVLATHDLGEARRLASEVVFMVRGRVRESAPAKSFFAGPATWEAQAFLNGDLVI